MHANNPLQALQLLEVLILGDEDTTGLVGLLHLEGDFPLHGLVERLVDNACKCRSQQGNCIYLLKDPDPSSDRIRNLDSRCGGGFVPS